MYSNGVSVTIPLHVLKQTINDGIEEWLVNTHREDWDGEDNEGNVLTIDFGADSEKWYDFQADGLQHILKELELS